MRGEWLHNSCTMEGLGRGQTSHLTLLCGFWGERGTDPVLYGDGVNENVILRNGEERLFLLAEVELHHAVFAEDVGQEGSVGEGFLADLKSRPHLLPVFGEGKLHQLLALEVLRRKEHQRWENSFLSFPAIPLVFPPPAYIHPFFPPSSPQNLSPHTDFLPAERPPTSLSHAYRKAADDIVLPKGLAKLLKLPVFHFQPSSVVAVRKLILPYSTTNPRYDVNDGSGQVMVFWDGEAALPSCE